MKKLLFCLSLLFTVSVNAQNVTVSPDVTVFNIYPNPSSGIFTIILPEKNSDTKICIYDLLGNCILNKKCKNEISQKIDISNQSKGIYLMEIICNEKRAVQRIVVQ